MEKLLNVENEWDGIVDCDKTHGPCCQITKAEVTKALHEMKQGKAAGPMGVVSEMMKAAGDRGVNWLTTLFNNIVKEGRIPTD